MKRLFVIWILILPFSWVFHHYTGFVAPDKLLAVFLLVRGYLLVLSKFSSTKERSQMVIIYTLLIIAFIFTKNLSFIFDLKVFGQLALKDAIQIGYFLVPLVCISNQSDFRKGCWAFVICAIFGCLSVFMVSVGILKLPVERFEVSRIGIEALPKAIGVFTSYGDLAQYLAFAVAWFYIAPSKKDHVWFHLRLQRFTIALIGLMGLLGAQSRNMLVSLIIVLFAAWFFKKLKKIHHEIKGFVFLGLFSFFLIGSSIAFLSATYVVDVVTGLGGNTAQQTVHDRFQQYQFAWNIIKGAPILGADLATFNTVGPSIEGIHNFWLKTAALGGAISLAPLIIMLGSLFTGIWKIGKYDQKADEALVIKSYLIVMLFATLFYGGQNELFWALLGLGASLPYLKVDEAL